MKSKIPNQDNSEQQQSEKGQFGNGYIWKREHMSNGKNMSETKIKQGNLNTDKSEHKQSEK